jgi:serine/threonine protein phosphatase PrpC
MTARTKPAYAALTDVGRMRSHNEDSVLAQPPLFAVADGLGGHEAGEVASSIAVETLRDHAPRRADSNALGRAVRAANREVLRAAREGIGRSGMGTTITAAIVEGGCIAVAHVGDSRAYLLHGGVLQRLTQDHSMVADMIRRGQLSEADARIHPNRSVITRALGTDVNMVADSFDVDASAGDRLLLCSDGLTGMLEDARIAEILGGYRDPEMAARALIDAANEAGGHDNISVVVVDIETTAAPARGTRETDKQLRGRVAVLLWILAFLAVVAAIGYGTYFYANKRAFLAAENGVVVVYRGVPGELAGYSLKWPVESTSIPVAALPPSAQQRLARGEQAGSLEEALNLVQTYRAMAGEATPGTEPTSAPSP